MTSDIKMFAVVGAAGKVGYATSAALRKANMPVRAILRDLTKASRLREIGCEIVVADILDSESLARAIGDADAVQVILPPSPQAKYPAEEMQRGIQSIASALEQTRPKLMLAVSDYGAHIAHDIGMPTLCRAFEERLSKLHGHKAAFESIMSPSLADLLIKANDAQNKGGLVDVEPNASKVRYGTTELLEALRPLVQSQ